MNVPRLHYVTERYRQLQGLRLLPIAVVCLLSAAWRAGWFRLPGDDGPLGAARWFALFLAAAVAASYPLRAWYSRRFGRAAQGLRDSPLPLIVAVVACMSLAIPLERSVHWPVSLPAAVLGAAMAGIGLAHYPFRRHYLAVAAVFFAYALLPALGVDAAVRAILFPACIGAALAIAGIGDHLLVARTLGRETADA